MRPDSHTYEGHGSILRELRGIRLLTATWGMDPFPLTPPSSHGANLESSKEYFRDLDVRGLGRSLSEEQVWRMEAGEAGMRFGKFGMNNWNRGSSFGGENDEFDDLLTLEKDFEEVSEDGDLNLHDQCEANDKKCKADVAKAATGEISKIASNSTDISNQTASDQTGNGYSTPLKFSSEQLYDFVKFKNHGKNRHGTK